MKLLKHLEKKLKSNDQRDLLIEEYDHCVDWCGDLYHRWRLTKGSSISKMKWSNLIENRFDLGR